MSRLARVLSRPESGGVTERMVRAMLRERLAQEWRAADGSTVITQLRSEPAGDVCLIWLAEGALEPCLELHEQIVEWAKGQGCKRIRIVGRRGWLKMVSGYREVAVVMEMDLG